jgi:hypothetical protein
MIYIYETTRRFRFDQFVHVIYGGRKSSTIKLNWRLRWYLCISPRSSFLRSAMAPPTAISPPWVLAADASHGHEIFFTSPRLDADKDQSLSRTRNPHAVSSRALIFIDWMRSKPLFIRISNSAPLFSSPAIFFIFFHPCKPTGKKEKKR